MLSNAERYRIPVINIVGSQDANWYPITEDGTQGFMATSKVKIEGLNTWLKIDGYDMREVSFENSLQLVDRSLNTVESKLGIKVDAARIIRTDTRYYVGDLLNDQKQNLIRIVLAENVPHMTSANHAAMAWDFMKQFSRDRASGQLTYVPNSKSDPDPTTF